MADSLLKRRAKSATMAVLSAFFCYVVGWTVTTKNPVGEIRVFLAGPAAKAAQATFPPPPDLGTLQGRLSARDQRTFSEAMAIFRKDMRKGGAAFWPLLSSYPFLRPSLSFRYYTEAVGSFQARKYWRSRELGLMAVAIDPASHRAHGLLDKVCGVLQRKVEQVRHRDLSVKHAPDWRPPTPGPDWSVIILILLGMGSVAGVLHTYQDKIGLKAFLDHRLFGIVPTPGMETFQGDAPTTIQNLDELRAVRREKKKSITAILSAEAFLKDIQDSFDQKEYEKGVDLCAKAVELNPAHAKKVAALCLAEGIRLFEIGDYQNARELLEVSLHFEPHVLEAHTCLGNCFIKIGDFANARIQYERVIESDPKNSSAYYTLGVCYQKVNDLPRAKRSFQVAVQLDDNHANCHFYLAKLHEQDKDYLGAIQHWKRFVELKPTSPHAAAAKERLVKLANLAGAGAAAPPTPPEGG